ncbi:hypothetical protein NDU88_006162 [Pleurodeles waltl]|uniref:Uncharacterized protein n=1 Tax=Pleurodeles waltl TaxID=8319 RepID=A0AAV7VNU5_PLEWA|nr:hypothetical protein NDU88_006162 [Pleurodeles waltl]
MCNSFLDVTRAAAAAPGGTHQGSARGGKSGEVRRTVQDYTCTADAWPSKWHPTTAVSSSLPSPEDQEAAKPEIQPHSGESVALAGMVLQRTQD